jgi:hypothetical protein
MEDGMHVPLLVQAIEDGSCDVADSLSNDPDDSSCRDGVDKWFEGYKDTETHTHKTEGLYVRMLLELDETNYGSGNGTQPDKQEEPPAPIALCA